MSRRSGPRWWFFVLLLLGGGTLFQTSCTSLVAEGVAGLAGSIASQFISNVIYDALGVSGITSLST